MAQDLLELYRQASEWTGSMVAGAADRLDDPTPCEEWDVRTLLNHMVETQRFFAQSARGENPSLPSPEPPDLVGDDPVGAYARARDDTLQTFGEEGVIERTGPSLGIAFSDALLHGWDLATATGKDATMPDGLAEAAYDMIHGRFTDEQRKGLFDPEIPVAADASPQDKLLGYTGRDPERLMSGDAELRRWVDKLAIREIVERSVRFIDDQDAPAFADLFEEDGVMQLSGTVFAGRQALRDMFGGAGGVAPWTEPGELLKQPRSMHLTTNPVVEVDGDMATAETDMVTLRRDDDGRAKITLLARYRDRLRRADDGRWLISSRTGVSLAVPGEEGTDAEWARALANMPDEVRARFRMNG